MKKFFITLLVIAIAALIIQPYTAWWSVAAIAFIVSYLFRQHALVAFLAGFAAIFVLWVAYAWFLSSANNNMLAGKVAALFKVSSVGVIYLITGVIGGLVAGFAALTGNLAAKLR